MFTQMLHKKKKWTGVVVGLAGLVLVFAFATGNAEAAIIYSLAADWSDSVNPNGVWSYNKSPGVPFATTEHQDDYDPVGQNWFFNAQLAWAAARAQLPGHVPSLMKIVSDNTMGWDMPIGSVLISGAEGSAPAVWPGVTWTSPIDGTVVISGGVWMSNEELGRTMEWHLLSDTVLKSKARITKSDGYSSSNLMSFALGSGGSAALTMPVSQGTVITFQADKPFGNLPMAHQLGVDLTIEIQQLTTVPEPSSFLLVLSSVGAGIFIYRIRRRKLARSTTQNRR